MTAAPRVPRLLVVGPNLTIDRTARIPQLRPGAVLRTGAVAVTPGGKGVNVARTARLLGVPACLVAFTAGRVGDAVAAMLADEGVELSAVDTGGELRSTSVLTDDAGRTTVINEPGPPLEAAAWAALEASVQAELDGAAAVVCSGSLPPGAPDDGYARIAAAAHAQGLPVYVDTAGQQLAAVLDAGADVVLPNLGEAELLLGLGVDEDVAVVSGARARAERAARSLAARGAVVAVVTAGGAGAAVATADSALWVPAPTVTVANPIGAGDAFTAAFAIASAGGASPDRAARRATATAAAAVEHPVAGLLDPTRIDVLEALLPGNP